MKAFKIVMAVVVAVLGLTASSSHGGLADNLLAYWQFEDNYNDSSGNGKDLTGVAGTGAVPGFAGGLIGQAVDFDNPQDLPHAGWLTRPQNDADLNIGTNDWTIQAWINLDSLHDEQVPIEKLSGVGGVEGWGLSQFGNGRTHFPDPGVTPPGGLTTSVAGVLVAGEWHQLVAVRRDDEFCLITDGGSASGGAAMCETGLSGVEIPSSPNPVIVGRRNAGDDRGFGMDGKMDEVAIWGRGLSDLEIETLYNDGDGLTVGEPPEIRAVEWSADEAGDWNNALSWTPARIPNAANITAVFGDAINATRTVFTDENVTIQAAQFVNPNRYVIAGGGSVSFDAGTSAPTASMDVFVGDHEFQTPVSLNSDTVATIAAGSSLTFNNVLNLQANTLTSLGGGTLNINNNLTTGGGTVVVNGGTVAGNGTVSGDLSNQGGTISPGSADAIVGGGMSVPEPSTFVLCGLCLVGLLAGGLRNRSSRELPRRQNRFRQDQFRRMDRSRIRTRY